MLTMLMVSKRAVKLLCCTSETNVKLCVNYTLIKKWEKNHTLRFLYVLLRMRTNEEYQ